MSAANPTATQPSAHAIMERVLEVKGDLAQLSEEERHEYYMAVVESVGLNSLTRPFEYITLEGKLVLYARKDATEQLRKIHGVSTKIVSRDLTDNIYTVHVQARDKFDREDEDIGAVHMANPEFFLDPTDGQIKKHPKAGKPLIGLDRANCMMKGVTKAKRRVTLSICGLGMLDESEVADALAAEKLRDAKPAPRADAVRPPKPGEKKALPPKVGETPAEPEDKPEPVGPDRDAIFVEFKAALDKMKTPDKLQRALIKANKAMNDALDGIEDDELFGRCEAYYKERLDELRGDHDSNE